MFTQASRFIGVFMFSFLAAGSLQAQSLYEQFLQMETKMKQLESEVKELKTQNEQLEKALKSENEQKTNAKGTASSVKTNSDSQEEDINEVVADLEESVEELSIATGNNHLKFNVDYRFAIDNLQYKMAEKDPLTNDDTKKNDALFTNRLWLNLSWAATRNLSFKGQLAYQKAFGHRDAGGMAPLEDFDWIASENPYDGKVRVKNAYFFYHDTHFIATPVSWTFSIGRRPSTNGHLINFRDDDQSASPNGHSINVEFDGLSAKFGFEEWVPGMYVKFCAGRGLSNASSKFFAIKQDGNVSFNPPYVENPDSLPNIDLGGLIFEPYSDGQYTFLTQYYYAKNLIDAKMSANQFKGFEPVGNLHSFTASFIADGIGDGWTDYLDDTTFFISAAMSKTDPNKGEDMFHSRFDADYARKKGQSETGYSAWVGLSMPSLISEEGKWGIEYNWGSRYWRSITYAEDTLIGSKVAARGSAYEIYFTEPLVEDMLSLQLRYTYIDYDYAGSDGFFGETTGGAHDIAKLQAAAAAGDKTAQEYARNIVDTAQDIRFYIRYRY